MRQSFNIQFYAREAKKTKAGLSPLELAININGDRKFINLPYKIRPEDFKKKRQPKELVEYMALMRTRINEILTEMLRQGEPLTTQGLIGYIKNGGYKSYTAGDLFDEFLELQRERVGKTLTKASLRKYELVTNLFFENADRDMECPAAITRAAVLKFRNRCEAAYEQATTAGYMRRLKTIVQYAIDNGRLSINPFQGIKIKRGEKPIVYLKDWEQKVLINAKIDNASLDRIRDYAVLQMSTGMSYADLQRFSKKDIREQNGVYYIEKPRQKTGKIFTAVILKPGLDVLDKYEGEIPHISNTKYNLYLKTLQDLLGIGTVLTTHVFRKTYATNLINAGVRIETVASALGHGINICRKYYAQLTEQSIISEINSKVG